MKLQIMEFNESNPLPEICEECEDRKGCLSKGEPEWCCDECDYALLRWMTPSGQKLRRLKS